MEDRGFQRLVSERLLIRRFRPEDARALATYRSDPEVARLQAWQAPYTQKAAAAFIASLETLSPGIPETWFQFAVGLRKGEPLIGDLGLRLCADPRQAEIGFTLAGSYQGKGYALEALGCLLRYVFEGTPASGDLPRGAGPPGLSSFWWPSGAAQRSGKPTG